MSTDGSRWGPGDVTAPLLRNLGGGALLVLLTAGLFWGIGLIGRADDSTGDAIRAADPGEGPVAASGDQAAGDDAALG